MILEIDSLEFHAETAGRTGDPLVLLLHGFPQTSYSWRHQLQPLAEAGYYAVAPDQRGYSPGARPGTLEAYATERLVDDALAIARVLGYESMHLVGHDWGGQLAWLVAAHHGAWLRSLTVLSRPHPRAFQTALAEDSEQASRSGHHRAFQDASAADDLLMDDAQRLRNLFGGQDVNLEDQNAYLRVLGERVALDAAINWYRAAARTDAASPLAAGNTPAVAIPTLYLWGNQDATVGRLAAEETANWMSGSYQFQELDGVGHFITDQIGTEVSERLLAHLSQF